MLSMGASYARLHLQQEHCRQKMKRKEAAQVLHKARGGEKKAAGGRVHPAADDSSSGEAKADLPSDSKSMKS